MRRFIVQLCLTATILLLAGCGTKGDLYLPEDAGKSFSLAGHPVR